jgi:protein SCO1/2
MLVSFVYTTCPAVCQALGAEYTRLQDAVSAADPRVAGSIELVSLSFDVEKDTSARLATYARLHGADDRVWTIAAPLSRDASERTLRALGVIVIADGNGGYVHNGFIHAMTPDGRVLAIFDDGEWQTALAFAKRLLDASP